MKKKILDGVNMSVHMEDEADYIHRNYSQEQINKMLDEIKPKIRSVFNKIIIFGNIKRENINQNKKT